MLAWIELANKVLDTVLRNRRAKATPAPEPERRSEKPRTPEGWTPKQAAYIAARQRGIEPTPAARAAGYSAKSAAQIAHSNEFNPRIVAAIAEGGDIAEDAGEPRKADIITRERIRRGLARIANGETLPTGRTPTPTEQMRASRLILEMDEREPKCAVCGHDPRRVCVTRIDAGICELGDCKECEHGKACFVCEHRDISFRRMRDAVSEARAEEEGAV